MNRVLAMLFGGCLLLAGGMSQAAEQRYLLQGGRSHADDVAYIEVWGHAVNGVEPYASPGPGFDYLMAGANAATHAALLPFTTAWARVSYDPTLAPLSTASNGNSATYAAGPLTLSMEGGAGGAMMTSSEVSLSMFTLSSAARQYFSIAAVRAGSWGQALPGIAFSYAAPPVPQFGVDLLSMINSDNHASGFDLSGFDTLPVRLEAPTLFRPVMLSVWLSRSGAPGAFDTSVPASLTLADWSEASISIVFDGVYGVSVDRADYASDETFAAASAWVSTHVRQIHYETGVNFEVNAISAVPEPASTLLLALGLGTLFCCRRVRGHRSTDRDTMPSAPSGELECAGLVGRHPAIAGPAAARKVCQWRAGRSAEAPKGSAMNRVLMTMLGGLLLLAGTARAADQSYVLQGSRVSSDGDGYLEVFGFAAAGQEPYANVGASAASSFDYLMAGSRAASNAALASFAAASATLNYDPALAPLSTTANGRSARYLAGPLSITVDAGSSSVPMSTSDLVLLVNKSTSGNAQNVAFTRSVGTVEGPLPGIVFSYSAPPAAQLAVDLVALVDPASGGFSRGFDLNGFESLPIRLEAPTVFRPVTLGLRMSRFGPAGSFDIAPPASLSLQDWLEVSLSVVFDGVYGVAVDRADYASDEAHAAAAAWVSTHIRQIDFETAVDFNVSSISAVPEPASALLLALGLGLLLSCRRSRRC